MSKLLKDLLYGGRNEYFDIVRLLGFLGGLVFLGLTIAKFIRTGEFNEWGFVVALVALVTGLAAAIYGRARIDRIQREDSITFAPPAAPSAER